MKKAWIILALLTLAAPASGSEYKPIPRLGDHVFVPVMALEEPFINTHIQTTVSLGNTRNATVPVIDIEDDTILGTAKADILLAGIGFKYQHKVKEWLAAGVDMDVTGRIGTSTPSLVSEGLTGGLGFRVGWLMSMYRSEKFQLSGSVGLGNSNNTFINLVNWAEGILEGEDVSLVQSRQSLRGDGGFHAAWSISRRFGLLGALKFSYGEPLDSQKANSWNHDGRLGLSYDLKFDLGIPLGIALTGGHFEKFENATTENGIWLWSVRVAVQSRDDFSLGFDLQTSYLTSVDTGKKHQLGQFTIDMRYFY